MMGKEDLLKILEQALVAEEKAIPIYTKHLSSASFWPGLNEEIIKKIRKDLHILSEESHTHKNIVEHLIETIRAGVKDAY